MKKTKVTLDWRQDRSFKLNPKSLAKVQEGIIRAAEDNYRAISDMLANDKRSFINKDFNPYLLPVEYINFLFAADNPNTSPDTLALLAKDEGWDVRRAVARNTNTPVDTLAKLAKDKDSHVQKAAIANPRYNDALRA